MIRAPAKSSPKGPENRALYRDGAFRIDYWRPKTSVCQLGQPSASCLGGERSEAARAARAAPARPCTPRPVCLTQHTEVMDKYRHPCRARSSCMLLQPALRFGSNCAGRGLRPDSIANNVMAALRWHTLHSTASN
jgi:hypothetical protein